MLELKFSLFNGYNDAKPKTKKLCFDDLLEGYLARHDIREEKDGMMFSGTTFEPCMARSTKTAREVSMGVFDFDIVDPEKIRQTLADAGFRAVLVSTHSHTLALPCFRAIIPFAAPVPARMWPPMWSAFNELFDGAIDKQTKSVAQPFYLPSCPPQNINDAFVYRLDGEIFDALSTLTDLGYTSDEKDSDGVSTSRFFGGPTGSSSKECPRKLAEEILRTMFHGQLKYFNFEFYAYTDGYWKPQHRKVDIEKRILDTFKMLNVGIVKQIVENLEALTVVEEISPVQNNGGRLLCLNNGTLDLKTATLLAHDPDHNLVNKMNVDWNPGATAPIFCNALNEMFKHDDDCEERIQFVFEWFGYCLIPDISQHKFLWLVGSGGNGKSIILNTLAALIGKDNVSHAMLERMGRPSVRAEMHGKLVNISPEMKSDATVADGYLKAYVGGDWVEAERKYQPSFSYQPFVRITAATNSLPYLKDTTDGFFRRAIILELTRQFAESEMDKQLQEKILSELDGILVLAVQGLVRLLKRGEFIIPESAIKTLNKYRDESDIVRYFVKEACVPDNKGMTATALYEKYKDFAMQYRFPGLNLIKFGKKLTALGIGSRISNGDKYWLLTEAGIKKEHYRRESLSDVMNDE
jgi:putative DNA primase/helicase